MIKLRFTVLPVCFGVSIAINATALGLLDYAMLVSARVSQIKQALKIAPASPKDPYVRFEYIDTFEASKESVKHSQTKRISDKNSQARNLVKNNTSQDHVPASRQKNMTNQLAKTISSAAAQSASAESKLKEEQKTKEKPDPKKFEKLEGDIFQESIQGKQKNLKEAKASPESKKQEPINGSKASEKMLSQFSSNKASKGAMLYGATSFEATGSGMGVYMKNMKEKIWAHWFPYLSFRYPQDFRAADAVISFTLSPFGDIKKAEIVYAEGNAYFAQFCMESVLECKNFGMVPKDILALLGREDLEIKFAFHYR